MTASSKPQHFLRVRLDRVLTLTGVVNVALLAVNRLVCSRNKRQNNRGAAYAAFSIKNRHLTFSLPKLAGSPLGKSYFCSVL